MIPLLLLLFLQAPGGPGLAEQADRAIDRGVEALVEAQLIDGSWEFVGAESPCGQTAMCLYTLLRCGVAQDHPAVELGYTWLAAHEPSDKLTYNLAWMLMAWGERPGDEAEARMKELLDQLLEQQDGSGLFTYGDTPVADLSNSQYAALGMRAAQARGLKVPAKAWKDLVEGVLRCQVGGDRKASAAGFSYLPGDAGPPPGGPPPGGPGGPGGDGPPGGGPTHGATGSMTAAGVATLTAAEQALGRKLSRKLGKELERARELGLAWLSSRWSVERNPSATGGPGGQQWLYHYLYGLERTGSFLEQDRIGSHEWYPEGARFLVARQTREGRWGGEVGEETDTCLALLFLKRASLAYTGESAARARAWGEADPERAVSLRATGAGPVTIWVCGFGDQARADLAWPGEQQDGLRVKRVEYSASRTVSGSFVPFGQVDGDPSKPHGDERFSLRHGFPSDGSWWLRARVVVAAPPQEGATAAGAEADAAADPATAPERVLESAPLQIETSAVLDDIRLGYATDSGRNLLRGADFQCSASSRAGADASASAAADGLYSRGWRYRRGDASPWWKLELKRAVPARALLIRHAGNRARDRAAPRPARVELLINGKVAAAELVLDPDPSRKTRFAFPKRTRVREIELRLIGAPSASSGIGEVELQ